MKTPISAADAAGAGDGSGGRNDRRERREVWLPILVVTLGWALSVGAWWLLVTERRQTVLESTEHAASRTHQLLGREVDAYLLGVQELARLWERVGRRPLEHWQIDVASVLRHLTALDYVAWSDPDGGPPRISSVADRPGKVLRDLESTLARAESPSVQAWTLDSPVLELDRDPANGSFLRVILPVGPAGEDGLLLARVDLAALLGDVLQSTATGYAVDVSWGDQEIFSRGAPSEDVWQRWWSVEQEAALPLGMVWTLRHRPTAELAETLLTPIPHYLLVSGLVLSLLLAALAQQLRLTLRQSRFLSASNRAFEERGDELEQRVAERTAELEEAVNELRAFGQTISHDLRSPLGAVLNFTTILEEDYRDRPLDEEGMEILARIRRSATRATALLGGLLRHSRAGRVTLAISTLDMRSLALEIFAQARAAEGVEDVEFVAESMPPVEGDRALLGDVFTNLFTNALKYSGDAEKPRITVRGEVEGDECIYEVADNGRGFDMRFEKKLFGMFERLDPDDGIDGTGAGLAIVERIVRRHGGRVFAEGRPGEGARFCFALPRTQRRRS